MFPQRQIVHPDPDLTVRRSRPFFSQHGRVFGSVRHGFLYGPSFSPVSNTGVCSTLDIICTYTRSRVSRLLHFSRLNQRICAPSAWKSVASPYGSMASELTATVPLFSMAQPHFLLLSPMPTCVRNIGTRESRPIHSTHPPQKIHAKRPARSQKEARRAVPAFDTNIACPPTGHMNARRFGLVYSEAYASCVSRLFIRCDRSSQRQAVVRTVGAYPLCRAECSGRVLGKCSYYGASEFLCGRFFSSVLRSFPFSPWPHPLR